MSGKRRMQIFLIEDAVAAVSALVEEANENFEAGSINFSDAINEMILNSKVDVKLLQCKHTDIRRSLRLLAAKENLDLENVIKTLIDLKARAAGGTRKGRQSPEAAPNG